MVSTNYYKDISGVILETLADGQPPIQDETTGSLSSDMMIGTVDFLFPPAHAGVGSFLWGAINFIVPFESVGILAQQLYFLARNDDRFDRVEFIVSALGTLSVIPVAKPLKPLLPSIRSFLKAGRNVKPEFYKSLAGPMGNAIKEAAFGRTALVRDWLVVLVLISEMIADEEARESLVFLLNTVQSEDDLEAVVQWLTLPAEEWIGEGLVRAEIGDINDDTEGESILEGVTGFFIKDADAVGVRTIVSIRTLAKALKPLAARDRRDIIRGIKAIVGALRLTANSLRGIAHSPQLLTAGSRLASSGLKALVRNTKNLRIGPVMIVSILSYVESRETCDFDPFATLGAQCKPFPDLVTRRNLGKWDNLIERINTAKRVTGNMNGALFHLLVLASYQLQHELGLRADRPVAQEFAYKNMIIGDLKGGGNIKLDREVDIVLDLVSDAEAANLERRPSAEAIWVEVKSLGRTSLGAPLWTVKTGKTTRHRQFAVDCNGWKNPAQKLNGGIRWWLQDWNTRAKAKPPKPKPHMETLNTNLHKMPVNAIVSEYGESAGSKSICTSEDAKLFTFTNILVDTLLVNYPPKTVERVIAELPAGLSL